MKTISPSFSHINLDLKSQKLDKATSGKPRPLEEALRSEPKFVTNYDRLVKHVAQILHRNRNLNLFYRGQSTDHKRDGKTTLLPAISKGKISLQQSGDFPS